MYDESTILVDLESITDVLVLALTKQNVKKHG